MAGRFSGLHITLPGLGTILLRPSAGATTRTAITLSSNLPPIHQDGLERRGADISSVQQSKWNGATSSTSRSINNSSPGVGSDSTDDSINPSTSTLLHHQPFDNNDEMALTAVKPSYPSIEMNMEDYV
uniref:Uncharacterized protein n=1 Tax=Daphnia galeata TaxID=27404 RepID=A0A8J2RBL1_9CRUS|nr:unnamed protein product [Daphnia galeata]